MILRNVRDVQRACFLFASTKIKVLKVTTGVGNKMI
jgi:hypothetical protein